MKDKDITKAMHLIMGVKDSLQDMRNNGWEPLFRRAKLLCDKNEIEETKGHRMLVPKKNIVVYFILLLFDY